MLGLRPESDGFERSRAREAPEDFDTIVAEVHSRHAYVAEKEAE